MMNLKSTIPRATWGLHIETDTLDQFEEVLDDVVSELIYCNHISVTYL